MVCCTAKCQKWTTFSLSVSFLILGILTVTLWNTLIQSILHRELSLSNKQTKGYSMWKETPIPMYLEFHLFNWTNSDEVIKDPSIKPHFEERGPYTYHEHHIRENVTFNDNNTITFQTQRIWHFRPELSNGSLQDVITTINPILVTVANIVKYKHYLVKRGVNFFLEEKQVKLAITKTVDEFLFEGYDDPMLDLVHKLNISGFNVPFSKFGWFVERNESIEYDGVYNMNDGSDGIENLGILKNWNYNDRVSFYPGDCGKVEGTTGELWYPPKDQSSVKLFASDFCSSIELLRNGTFTLYGIEANTYKGSEKVFDNGTLYPEMKCFVPEGESQPSGVRNVSLCKFRAPVLASYPHFYLADQSYRDAVDGMNPDPKKHEMFIALEPSTGLPLTVAAAFQVNLKMEPIDGITLLTNVKPTLIPAFWFKQTAEMTDDLASQAKLLLILPSAGKYTGYGIIGLGIFLMLVGIYITYKRGWKETEEERLLNQQSL